jgi:hypothetical protein
VPRSCAADIDKVIDDDAALLTIYVTTHSSLVLPSVGILES